MSWIFDNVPWWVYLIIAGGGGGAILALVPGALAFVIGIYNVMPVWLRWLTGAVIVAWLAHIAGRNIGSKNERDKNKVARETAVKNRKEVDEHVNKLDEDEVDRELKKHGDFRESGSDTRRR